MKIKMTFFTILCFAGSLCVTAQTNLSFNPEKGAKYLYQQKMAQTINQTMMGQNIAMEQDMDFDYEMNIREKSTDGIQAQLLYKDMEYYLSSPMMKMAYSSKNPVETPSDMDKMLGKMFGCLIGKPFSMQIASDGSVKSVSGMDVIVDEMVKAAGPSDGQIAAQTAASMKQQFSDEAMKRMFEQSLKIYPPKAVKTGESWDAEQTYSASGMSTTSKTKYTLKEVKKNIAVVDFESTIEMKPATSGMGGKLAGTQTGVIQIDVKTGMPVSSDAIQAIKGTVSTNGMDISMSIDSKIKTTVTKN